MNKNHNNSSVNRIKQLSHDVISKIAAGEIIQQPWNVVKELIENSLDSGCDEISIVFEHGGLKLIQVQDNGSGIHPEDLPLLCSNHATSKLATYQQLVCGDLSTFGFRGEALSSISYVSDISVVTRSKNIDVYESEVSAVGKCYTCDYRDGVMLSSPKRIAGIPGTTISVKNIFYNNPVRLAAFQRNGKSMVSEQYSKVHDLVSRFALHHLDRCSFTLRKSTRDSIATLRTLCQRKSSDERDDSMKLLVLDLFHLSRIQNNPSQPSVQQSLHKINFSSDSTNLPIESSSKFYVEGLISSITGSGSGSASTKLTFVLFINDRLVECRRLKQCLQTIYTTLLSTTKSIFRPFVYLSIKLSPSSIDVNVHPAKLFVTFPDETLVIQAIQTVVRDTLLGFSSSNLILEKKNHHNNAQTQSFDASILKDFSFPSECISSSSSFNAFESLREPLSFSDKLTHQSAPRISPKDFDRSDPNKQKLTHFWSLNSRSTTGFHKQEENFLEKSICSSEINLQPIFSPFERSDIQNLSSVRSLTHEITMSHHIEISDILLNCSYVGSVDFKSILIQSRICLYLVNVESILREFFYQLIVKNLGRFNYLCIEKERKNLCDGLNHVEIPSPVTNGETFNNDTPDTNFLNLIPHNAWDIISSRSNILVDYFSIKIDHNSQKLTALPSLLSGYPVNQSLLPEFFRRLAFMTDWENEERCLRSITIELSCLYASSFKLWFEVLESTYQSKSDNVAKLSQKRSWDLILENSVMNYLLKSQIRNKRYFPSSSLVDTGAIIKISSVPELYKIFERC